MATRNGYVQVDIFLSEFSLLNHSHGGSSSTSSLSSVHRGNRRALFDAPLNELMRVHQLPPDSATMVSIDRALESLGTPYLKARIMSLVQQESSVLVGERPVGTVSSPSSSSRGMGIRIYVELVIPEESFGRAYGVVMVVEEGEEDDEIFNSLLEDSFEEAYYGSIKCRAAEEEAIEKLERFVVDDNEEDHQETCTVCMDDMEPGDRGVRMPCEHVYHEECIVKWLGVSCFCPNCRFELPPLNKDDQVGL